MTADEVLEAMARGFASVQWPGVYWRDLTPKEQAWAIAATKAAVRAAREVGAILVAEMPGNAKPEHVPWCYGDAWDSVQEVASTETLDAICNGYADGHNAALAAVRAKAVTP